MPSIGPVTAAAFVATIDDAQRFRHAHQVEAYLGLIPRECSSGDTQSRGPITKAGPGRAGAGQELRGPARDAIEGPLPE